MDNKNLIFGRVYATEAYLNEDSEIVLRQDGDDGDDHIVIIPTHHVDAVVARLLALKEEASNA